MDSETLTFFFFLIGLPILIGLALKFLLGKASPPSPDQETTDELLDEIEHTPRRHRRKRSSNRTSSGE